MKKKFIITVAGIAVIAVSAIVTISSVNARSTESDLLTANIEALTRDEGSGLLWDKEWTSCPIAEQVIVHYDCGGLRAGVYYYAAELEEFSKKNIVVPHSIRQMVAGRDSVVLNPANGDARLVVWVDSVACSSCRLSRIHEYSEIVSFSNETRNAFAPVFVFSPPLSKIDEILLTLQISQFDYPVFIDERGSFSAANPLIPTDSRFHTFLLDRNGKVVLVGDPVNNPRLWELYKITVTQLIENDGTLPIVEK